MANMELIETKTVGSGGSATIEFTSITQTYTDLYLVCSLRSSDIQANGGAAAYIGFNTYGTAPTNIALRGQGSGSPASFTNNQFLIDASDFTSSTFGNMNVYIPNYSSTTVAKSFSIDSVNENNATLAETQLNAQLWNSTSAITSIKFTPYSGNFVQYSTVSLYGISAVPSSPKATGGIVSQDATYWYHTFPFSSTFTPTQALSADILCIAGGGGGGSQNAGGGGAGGLLLLSSQSLTATGYSVSVGAGGAQATTSSPYGGGSNGGNSQFASLTAAVGGGGGGGRNGAVSGANGGSGGGAPQSGSAGTGTSGQGNNGGGPSGAGGGGGGAGEAGNTDGGGYGGDGVSTYSAWGLATFTGQIIGGSAWFAGGGAGATVGTGVGGGDGGGGGSGQAGIVNTGGGGGSWDGNATPFNGGSGLVIVRYAK